MAHPIAAEESTFDVADIFQPSAASMPIIDPGLKEFGRLWIQAEYIEPTKAHQRWRSGARVQPSLCMLFQSGQCNGGPKCNQAHVKLQHMARVREALRSRPFNNCCLSHGDLPSRRRDFLAFLERCSVQLRLPGQPVPLHPKLLAITGFFDSYLLAANGESKLTISIDPARVCNLHQRQQCKYGADCHNVHVCRHFWATVSGRPPSPPEMLAPGTTVLADGPPSAPSPVVLPASLREGPHGSVQPLVTVPLQPPPPVAAPTPVGVTHMMVPVYTITLTDGSSVTYTPQLAFVTAQPQEVSNALPVTPPLPGLPATLAAPMSTLLPSRPSPRPPMTHSCSTGALPFVATPHCKLPPTAHRPTGPPPPTAFFSHGAPPAASLAPLASLESRTAASISRSKRRESAPDITSRPPEPLGAVPLAAGPAATAPSVVGPAAAHTPMWPEAQSAEAWMHSRRASAPTSGSPFAAGINAYLSEQCRAAMSVLPQPFGPGGPATSAMRGLASFWGDTEPATPNTITSECASSYEPLECDSDPGSLMPPEAEEVALASYADVLAQQTLFQGNFHFLDAAAVGLDLPLSVMNELREAVA